MGDPLRLRWLASLALLAPGLAHAQQSPPPPPPAAEAPQPAAEAQQPADTTDEIVVLADQSDQVRIDRRTYTLRDDPGAQAMNMFEVLGRVPSVSVAPSGAVTLLGAPNVTIQINGQPVPGNNLEQILRGLTGSDVERIEVITNPSAQYSAQASGGIINIITRQRFNAGFNGSLQAGVDNEGSYHVGVSPNWSRGPWSLSGGAGVFGGEFNQDFDRERTVFSSSTSTSERGDQSVEFSGWYLNRLTLGYRPNDRRRMSLAYDAVSADNDFLRTTTLSDDLGPLSDQTAANAVEFRNQQIIFDFQQNGAEPRELLKFNAVVGQTTVDVAQTFTFDPVLGSQSQFRALQNQDTDSLNSKLDYERPVASDNFLTTGLAFDVSRQQFENARQTLVGPPAVPDFLANLDGRQQTLAAYATYQFDLGDWTILPGVRGEQYRRELVSSGFETDTNELDWFPSLHVRRPITPDINADVSYARRIQRPGLQQLDPAPRFSDVNRASAGNPDLAPTFTDAYEINLTYQKNGASYGLTFYDRISDDIISPFTETLPSGVILTIPVNAGASEQRGVQALLRGPLGHRWRYSLSANVLNRQIDVLDGGVVSRREELEYDGVASIDYRDPDQEHIGANQLQFELRFQGPRHTLQSDSDEFIVANFTWRRRLSQRLYGVLVAQDIFSTQDNVNEVTTDDFFEHTEIDSAGARVRLALTYQFGDGPQRPPPDAPAGPPIPVQ